MKVKLGDQTITDRDNMVLVHGFVVRACTLRKKIGRKPVDVTIKKGAVWIVDNITGRCLKIEIPR